MKEIGGFIEFEYSHKQMLHEDAVKLNCGRNALAYLILAKGIRKIVLPYFLCDSVRNLCKKYGVDIRYYSITHQLLPENFALDENEWLYVVNLYGQLSGSRIEALAKRCQKRLIVDNAQAYFDMPVASVDTIYTCRKFFGVADGAILYTDTRLQQPLERDKSFDRMEFLMGRMECGAAAFYEQYIQNNALFAGEPIKKMSILTENLLRGIDYEFVKKNTAQITTITCPNSLAVTISCSWNLWRARLLILCWWRTVLNSERF